MPLRRQGTQASQAAASQSSDTADSTRSLRTAWSPDQELRLLELILEAKRDGQLVSKKATFVRAIFEKFIPILEDEFPGRPWNIGMLENKHRQLRDFWRAFKDAAGPSGQDYSYVTGKCSISEENAALLKARHGEAIYKKVDRGLLRRVGDFDFAEWYEVFSDDQMAGLFIAEASDDAVFEEMTGGIPASSARTARQQEEDADTEMTGDSSDTLPLPVPLALRQPARATPTTPRASVSRPSVRAARIGSSPSTTQQSSSNPLPNRGPTNGEHNKQVLTLLSNLVSQGQQIKQHVITTRLPGAEDLEKAVQDSMRFIPTRGMPFVIRLIEWMKKDPTNPLIWNSLSSDEAKMAWAERIEEID